MKLLFIYTNINGYHEDTYPFGLASIIAIVKKNGHTCDVVLVKTKEQYSDILKKVGDENPDLIGFSAVSSQFPFVKEIASLIKRHFSDKTIVCGGVHPTINPACVLETNSLDVVFVGESEYSFCEFLNKLQKGESYQSVYNIAYVKNGILIKNPLRPLITNLDELPFPERNISLFEDTLKAVGYAPFFFSRGCPYLCTYCSNHAIAKMYGLKCNTPRYRSVESAIKEVEGVVKQFKVGTVLICDDIFGIDKKWRKEFCQQYKRRIKNRFFCLLRANVVDEEFVRLLKDAGCYRVSLGVESGNEYIRNTVMKRNLSTEQIIKAFDLLNKYRIQTNALNVIGVPQETEQMIWDTIQLNRRIKPTSSAANIFYPYKGTQLGDYCFEQKLVDENLYKDFSNERRESVIGFPEEHKKKLVWFRDNWEDLIFKYHFDVRIQRMIKSFLVKVKIWEQLVKIKRRCLPFFYAKAREGVKN